MIRIEVLNELTHCLNKYAAEHLNKENDAIDKGKNVTLANSNYYQFLSIYFYQHKSTCLGAVILLPLFRT